VALISVSVALSLISQVHYHGASATLGICRSWYSFYRSRRDERLNRPSWLVSYGAGVPTWTVIHPRTNRVRRRLTSLIRPTSLTTTPRRQPVICVNNFGLVAYVFPMKLLATSMPKVYSSIIFLNLKKGMAPPSHHLHTLPFFHSISLPSQNGHAGGSRVYICMK